MPSIVLIVVVAFSTGLLSHELKRVIHYDIDEVPGFLAVWSEVEEALKEVLVPGLVMTVVQDQGEIYKVWSKTFGYASLTRPQIPISYTGSKFSIGSLTKAFTVTLIGVLLTEHPEKYPLGWDTKLVDIMNDSFSLRHEIESVVTLRDILAHRTGLHSSTPFLVMGLYKRSPTEYCRRMKLLGGSEMRSRYQYNNMMFLLAECAAETMGGDTYANLIRRKLFEPIGMVNCTLLGQPDAENYEDVPLMYFKSLSNNSLVQMDQTYLSIVEDLSAAGAILSTGSAMAMWITFHLEHGRTLSGVRLVDPILWKEMHSSQMATNSKIPKWGLSSTNISAYGMGWQLGTYRDALISEHGGRAAGFDSKVTLSFNKGFGIFTSANGPAYNSYSIQCGIHQLIHDLFHNETIWLNRALLVSYPNFNTTDVNPPGVQVRRHTPDAQAYAGCYGHALFGNFTVSVAQYGDQSQGQLEILKFRYGRHGSGWLEFIQGTEFTIVYEGALEHIYLAGGSKNYEFSLQFSDMNARSQYDRLYVVDSFNTSTTFVRDYKWDMFASRLDALSGISSFTVSLYSVICIVLATCTVYA